MSPHAKHSGRCADCGCDLPAHAGSGRPRVRCAPCSAANVSDYNRRYNRRNRALHATAQRERRIAIAKSRIDLHTARLIYWTAQHELLSAEAPE